MFARSKPGVRSVNYSQTVASTTWTIEHNFGFKPNVDVMINVNGGQLQKAFPLSITHSDDNTVIVTWTTAKTGQATLSATYE